VSESVDRLPSPESDETSTLAADNALLAESAFALLSCETSGDVYEVIGDFLVRLVPGSVAVVNEATPELNGLIVRVVKGVEDRFLAQAAEVAGFRLVGREFGLSAEHRAMLLSGRMSKLEGGLSELVADGMPVALSQLMSRMFGITDCYSVGISDGERALGNCHVLTRADTTQVPIALVESFVRHCFSVLLGIERTASLAKAADRDRLLLASMVEGLALHEIILDELGEPCDYRFLDVNGSFEAMTGLTAGETIGRTVREVLPSVEPAWIERYGQVALTGRPARFEDHSAELGKTFRVVAYSPQPGQFATLIEDITEQRAAHDGLRLSEERLRLALAATSQGLYDLDVTTGVAQVTPEYLRMIGDDGSLGAFDLGALGARIHPDDVATVLGLVEAYTRGDIDEYRTDYRIRHANGDWIWVLSIGKVVERDADGRAVRVLGSHTDITASKRAEEALRQSADQLNRAQHYAHVGSWTWEIATNDLQWSDEMFHLFGIDQATFTGSLPDVIAAAIHPEDREAVERANRDVIENIPPTPLDYRVIWPDGSVHVVWAEAGELIFDDEGRPAKLSGTVQDITERRQTRDALLEAVHNLERSNQDLEHFAYIASHDLQEPLRMVAMYTELLRKRYHGQLDADADDFIDYAVEGAQRMSQLLADLLDYSRVGTRGTRPRPVSAETAMEQVIANLKGQIADTGASLTVGSLPTVMADDSQLMRIFQNLISNSLKFHRDGVPPEISVTAAREGAMWCFCIADNGIGIESDYFEQAFEAFRRLQPRGAYPGTGIGLAICKRIVERLGGCIWVERSGDTGTTFCFTLPAAS